MTLPTFTAKDWEDEPSDATEISSLALKNLENRVTDFALEVGTALLEDDQVVDSRWQFGEGDNISIHAGNDPGQKFDMRHGSSGVPVTDVGPSLKVSRTQDITRAAMEASGVTGTGSDQTPAIYGHAESTADNEAVTIGVKGSAIGRSTSEEHASSADAEGVVGKAIIESGVGGGFGLVAFASREVDTGNVTGVEVHADNNTTTDGAYNPSGSSDTEGMSVTATGDAPSAAGIHVRQGAGTPAAFKVGIGFGEDVVEDSVLRDDSSADRVLDLRGTHTYFLAVGPDAGRGAFMDADEGGTPDIEFWRTAAGVLRWNLTQMFIDGDIKIGDDIDHDGDAVGFFGATPAARVAAYTQTYSNATRTHSNLTSAAVTNNTAASPDTTVANISALTDSPATADALRDDLEATWRPVIRNNFSDLADQQAKIVADLANIKQVLNSVIDDHQTYGLFQ